MSNIRNGPPKNGGNPIPKTAPISPSAGALMISSIVVRFKVKFKVKVEVRVEVRVRIRFS
jgi:hypothetical protein